MRTKRLLLTMAGLGLSTVMTWAATATLMSVQIRKADIRDTPSFMGRILSSVSYGDKVTIQSENGAWFQVNTPGQSGWMHSSALTKKNIVMKSGAGAQTSASSGEMALAGKGFNSDVESQFKTNHKDIDFTWVDKMEKIKIPTPEIKAFAKAGQLESQGGVK